MKDLTEKVFSEIDRLTEKYTELLVDICNIESKSEDKDGVDKVGDFLAEKARGQGYIIKKREFEKAGNVYSFTMNPDGEKELISLSGHMDTVFEKGAFGYPPTKIEGDYIYGPGVQDCKGGIAIFMLCMEALKNCGYTERPVKLILQSDEEVGSCLSERKSIDFMVEEAKGSIAFLNGEGHTKGRITVGRKGIVKKKIVIEGFAVHSGMFVGGISAIKEAAHKIIALEDGNDVNAITFNCGLIQGGTTINTVPDRCEVCVGYRFKTEEQEKTAEAKFKKIVETSYVEGTKSYEVELSRRSPMERTEANENLANIINGIANDYGFDKMEMFESPGGADASYTTINKIPSVDSVGLEGANCHSIREKGVLSSLPKLAKLAAAVIINFPPKQ